MPKGRNKLYLILIISCLGGYLWTLYNLSDPTNSQDGYSLCIIKSVTSIPCPSCGSTRSVLSILRGNVLDAFYWNPIGIILVIIMIATPLIVFYDLAFRKEIAITIYKKTDVILKKRSVAIIFILLILANWIWNIYKGI